MYIISVYIPGGGMIYVASSQSRLIIYRCCNTWIACCRLLVCHMDQGRSKVRVSWTHPPCSTYVGCCNNKRISPLHVSKSVAVRGFWWRTPPPLRTGWRKELHEMLAVSVTKEKQAPGGWRGREDLGSNGNEMEKA